MRLFYYVHTGHRIGLDRFRRAVAIINALGDVNITLLTSDFRIASVARDFGIKCAVGIDVVRNIPQIAQRGDKIIFDSAEHNPTMLDDMSAFFSTFIRISDNPNDSKHPNEFLISPYLEGEGICKGVVVDQKYFQKTEKKIETSLFFGDDDYDKALLSHLEMFAPYKMDIGIGFYYFMDYEEAIATAFKKCYEFEEYDTLIMNSKVLVSASPQAILESLANGATAVFVQRPDYPKDWTTLFYSLGVPIVNGYDAGTLEKIMQTITSHKCNSLLYETDKVITFIKENLYL
jgi:hypothetical protein